MFASELDLSRPQVIQVVHIRFDVTAADWAALADFQLAHSPTLRRTMRNTYWLAAAIVIVLAGSIALFTRSMFFAGVALVAGGIAALGIPRSVQSQMRKQMHAMFDETFPSGASTTMRLEPLEDGLATESPQGIAVIAWSAFTVCTESPDYLYLGLGGTTGIVVPRGRLIEGDVDTFAAEVRRHVRG